MLERHENFVWQPVGIWNSRPAQEEGEGARDLRPLGRQRVALTAALDARHRGYL